MWKEDKTKEYKKYGSKGKVAIRKGNNNFIIEDKEDVISDSLNKFMEQEDNTMKKPITNKPKIDNTSNDRPDWAGPIVQFDESQSVLADGQKRKYGNLLLGNTFYSAAGDQSEPRWRKEKVEEFYYFNPQKGFSGNMGDLLIFPNSKENSWDVYDGLQKLFHISLMCVASSYLFRPTQKGGKYIEQLNSIQDCKKLILRCQNILFVKTLDEDYNEIKTRRISIVEPYDELFGYLVTHQMLFDGYDIDHLDYLLKTKYNDEYFRRLVACYKEHIRVQKEYIESFKDDDGNTDIDMGLIKLNEYYSWMLNNFWQTIKSEETREKIQSTMINYNYYSNPWHDFQNMNQVYLYVEKSNKTLIKDLWDEAKKSIIKIKDENHLFNVSKWNGWAKGRQLEGYKWVKNILKNSRNGIYYTDVQPLITFLKEIKEASDLYNEWKETKDERKKQLKEFTELGEVMPVLLATERNITDNDDKYKIIDELTRFMLTKKVIVFNKKWNTKWTEIGRIMCDETKLDNEKVDETIEIIQFLLNDHKDSFEKQLIKVRNNDSRCTDYNYNLKDTTLRDKGMNKMDESTFRSLQKYITNLLEDNPLYSNIPDIEHMFEVNVDMGVAQKLNCIDENKEVDYYKYFNYSQRISTTYPWNKSMNRGTKSKYKDKSKLYETATSHLLQRTQKRLVNPKGYLKKIDNQLAEPFGSNITEDKLNDYHKAYCKLITKLIYKNN